MSHYFRAIAVDYDGTLTSGGRHRKKYSEASLPPRLRFLFRDGRGLTGRSAGNLLEFGHELARSGSAVRHHARHGDFSRWIGDVYRDLGLARDVRRLEQRIATSPVPEEGALLERLRRVIEDRYLAGGVR